MNACCVCPCALCAGLRSSLTHSACVYVLLDPQDQVCIETFDSPSTLSILAATLKRYEKSIGVVRQYSIGLTLTS